jgi:hypothetical protein
MVVVLPDDDPPVAASIIGAAEWFALRRWVRGSGAPAKIGGTVG